MASDAARDVRAVRRWLTLTGTLSLVAGLVWLVGTTQIATAGTFGWLAGLIIGICLVVYGVAALTTTVGPRAAGSAPTRDSS